MPLREYLKCSPRTSAQVEATPELVRNPSTEELLRLRDAWRANNLGTSCSILGRSEGGEGSGTKVIPVLEGGASSSEN